MKEIGGFFELELNKRSHYYNNAIRLNTARNCLEYIVIANQYKKIFIPFYTCDVMIEPLKKHNIQFEFYHINEQLEPIADYKLLKGEAFLYTNYFGFKQKTVEKLAEIYGSQLIIDNAQAFYAPPLKNIDTFYSPRKFFGVPDGAYLFTNKLLEEEFTQDVSYHRMTHLLKRIDIDASSAYQDFKRNDQLLSNQPIKRMSKLTERLLSSINYDNIKKKRIDNFLYLDSELSKDNILNLDLEKKCVPMVYPYLVKDGDKIKKKLISLNMYVPTYWGNVKEWLSDKTSFEYFLYKNLIALPIDHRYGQKEIRKIIKTLIK